MRGIAFDCYGTLLRIATPLGATRRAIALLAGSSGPSPMTTDIPMADALTAAGVDRATARSIMDDMNAEAASVEALPGAIAALRRAEAAGLAVAVASNLSREYADPIRRLLPGVPLVLSFETGHRKPEAAFFDAVLSAMRLEAAHVTMIGDSRRCDHDGAIAAGMHAVLVGGAGQPDAAAVVDLILAR